ncbi:hypothetical protein [Mycobacterium sp. C31M]
MTRIIADHGGLVIAEDGPDILVIDRGNGAAETTAFVLLVGTLVCGGFGIIALLLGGVPTPVAAAVLGVGTLLGIGLFVMVRSIRRRRHAPLDTFVPIAVFDRARRTYRDGTGRQVPLDHIRIHRRMQLTSSSPKLVVTTPHGTQILKRGNPFGGGIGNLEATLTAAVFGPAQPSRD